MKAGRFGSLILALTAAILIIYSLRVWLLPVEFNEVAVSATSLNKPHLLAPIPASLVPDFSAIADVRQKKQAFFDYLRPTVVSQNALITKERQFIKSLDTTLASGQELSESELYRLTELANKYQFTLSAIDEKNISRLLARIDTVPEEMVLIQAANESGWGNSRFAKQGLNFFGQWCFKKGCGLVPLSREDGMNHEVAKFNTVDDSVAAYLKNLNSNQAYRLFRTIRAQARDEGRKPTAKELIYGLSHYSERQQAYVDELLLMLKHNQAFLAVEN